MGEQYTYFNDTHKLNKMIKITVMTLAVDIYE